MPAKQYPLDVQSVGSDMYIAMSKGHHDIEEFMKAAVAEHPGLSLGGPAHVWVKTTPGNGTYDCMYNIVQQGVRGAWPATYCWEFGEDYKRYNAEVQP